MAQTQKKLVTIITELSLEKSLLQELERCGVSGYTISDARGKGHRGKRQGDWDASSNIRVEVVCDETTAELVINQLREKYYDNFAMISFTQDVFVTRPNKF